MKLSIKKQEVGFLMMKNPNPFQTNSFYNKNKIRKEIEIQYLTYYKQEVRHKLVCVCLQRK